MTMTTPNKITIARIVLIPFFIFVTLDYIRDYQVGIHREWQRYLGVAIFIVAAVCDGVDGYIARRYKQKSELGTFLDPLADKALLNAGLLLMSIKFKEASPFERLPLWLPILVISRDAMLLTGTVLIHMLVGRVKARPRMVGKAATFFQMLTLGWVMLGIERPTYQWLMYSAGVCTFVSGVWYIFDGINQLNVADEKQAGP